MRKLPALCFALAAFLYASAANCRICFLGDTACQAGQFQVAEGVSCADQNSKWIYEYERCEGLTYGSPVCNDSTGNYYERGYCPSGYTDIGSLQEGKYICTSDTIGDSCGVSCCKGSSPTDESGDILCDSSYMICGNNSTGSGESCIDKEGTKYKRCICSKNTYATQCNGAGIEGNYSNYCINSDGETWYSSCSCQSGWTKTTLANIKCSTDSDCCACTVGAYTKLPGTDSYCWEGATCSDYETCKEEVEQCVIAYQSDFDNFWSGYDVGGTCRNLTVDCATLGYDSGSAGANVTCKDGTEPYRCPFDHTQVYCESGIGNSCEFISEADCELAYFGSNCTVDSASCYNPTSCKTGYGKSTTACANGEAGDWSLGSMDEYGCAVCQCESTCVNKISTIPGNATAVTEICQSCYQTTSIITGFTCNEGYTKSADGTSCVATCSSEYNLPNCPANAYCTECGNMFKFENCNDTYTYDGISYCGCTSEWGMEWGEKPGRCWNTIRVEYQTKGTMEGFYTYAFKCYRAFMGSDDGGYSMTITSNSGETLSIPCNNEFTEDYIGFNNKHHFDYADTDSYTVSVEYGNESCQLDGGLEAETYVGDHCSGEAFKDLLIAPTL